MTDPAGMSIRENYIRALEFRYPQWIPCSINFAPIVWKTYREQLERIVLNHPRLFPDYDVAERDFYNEMPLVYREGEYYKDNWGCTWFTALNGLEGQVVKHPLSEWSALTTYKMPDPLLFDERGSVMKDWDQARQDVETRKIQGKIASGNGERLFDRLYFLRGFENLMSDFVLEPPELPRLIQMLEEYEITIVQKWLDLSVDQISFHTDIGMQTGLMINPRSFRKYIKPLFTRLFQTCRSAGVHVFLSSDGCLLEIVDDLIECGVSIHDPQLRANTLPGIVKAYKGKLCAMVDLDRQGFPFLNPKEIRQQVQEVVDVMALPEGGLGLNAAVYGTDVSLNNISAICEAIEDYCFV
jgi:uroporphyrinogen decarboxylase